MAAAIKFRDTGLTLRMVLSFAILTIIYLVFISVLAYLGVGYLPIAIITSLMILAQWYFSDRIVLWSAGAKVVTRDQYPQLYATVEKITARNGLPVPKKIAVMNTNIPNAFATGRSPSSSVVAVTTRIMDILDKDELETVLAHELAHIKNRDVLVLTLASVFSTVAWYLMQFGFFSGMGYGYGGGRGGRNNSGGSAMLIVIAVAAITWFVSFLIIRAISRYREFVADRDSAIMTGKPMKLASALTKINNSMKSAPQREVRQVEGLNAFFIIPALSASSSSLAKLFSTHPPVEERIRRLMAMQASLGG